MEHSIFGASGMAMTEACPGQIRMNKLFKSMFPELANRSNPAAEEGTAAHELSEFALKLGCETSSCVGSTFNKHVVTEAMADYVNVYVGEIRKILAENPDAVLMVEKRVTMLSVASDVFGTGDCIIYIPSKRKLYNIDLKYGYGVVDVTDNIQLAHYSVSTFDTFQYWDLVDTVEAMIVQPRADHIDGVIRRFTFTRNDLIEWQRKFVKIVDVARRNDAPIVAGNHCTYCDAAAICRARILRTFEMAGLDAPLETLSEDEIMTIYTEIGTLTRTLEAVKQVAVNLGKSGKRLKGWKLVKARQWHVCDNDDAFIADVMADKRTTLDDDYALYNLKLKGKTDLKKLKGLPTDLVDKHFKAPSESLTLVKNSDSRPAYGVGGGLNRFSAVTGNGATTAKFPPVTGQ
ncbi:PD-(D/E)XK nuclease [Shewanella sp. phage 1/44]|uniref:exonuclease n=1 Tax=Shewanella sp. phage 1/44 TaxID=1458862 RepID=UPI0004F6A6F3|nr:exonuclease [Shewanella sp. phage 1/44]AHK11766.1 PD-(D/E)XK nuclease [Shewanella sp. phage 1/44]